MNFRKHLTHFGFTGIWPLDFLRTSYTVRTQYGDISERISRKSYVPNWRYHITHKGNIMRVWKHFTHLGFLGIWATGFSSNFLHG